MIPALAELAQAVEQGDRDRVAFLADRAIAAGTSAAEAEAGGATIVGMSALLTTTMTGMAEVISALERRGLRGSIKTIVGGNPLSAAFAEEIGADAYAPDGPAAVERVRALAGVSS